MTTAGMTLRRVPWAMIGAVVISVAVLWWFAGRLASDWGPLSRDLAAASPLAILAAFGLAIVFCVLVGACYHHSLRLAGASVRPFSAVSVYLASQLGKYIPGRVLYLAGHLTLAGWLGVPISRAALGFLAHHFVLVASGALLSAPLLGAVLAPSMTAVVVGLSFGGLLLVLSGAWIHPLNALQRRRGRPELVLASPARVVAALASALAGWCGYGLAMVLLSAAMAPRLDASAYLAIGLAAIAAWLTGFLSIITPAGLGVREGAFVLFVRPYMPEANAMAIAMVWRLVFTATQVPMGALALLILGRGRAPKSEPPPADREGPF